MPDTTLEYVRTMKRWPRRRLAWMLVLAVVAALVLGWTSRGLLTWTRWACTREWFDLTAGRIKTEDWRFFIKQGETIRDTPFTELYRKLVGEPPEPDWRLMNTFSPGVRHSPHYEYHTVYADARGMLEMFELAEFTADAKRKIMLTFTRLWPEKEHWSLTREYFTKVSEILNRELRSGDGRIEAEELPEAPPVPAQGQ